MTPPHRKARGGPGRDIVGTQPGRQKEPAQMSANHGSTPAAWTAVFIILIAFVIGGVAMVLDPVNWLMFWIAVVLLPVGAIVGKVMSAASSEETKHG
jgi:hypothetical protein